MAIVNLSHPVLIQHADGNSIQLHAGEGRYVPDELMGHPRVVASAVVEAPDVELEGDGTAPVDGDDSGRSDLSKDELIAMASELGVEIDKRWSASRIRAAIESA